ncbi:MAG: SLC13 family permease [Rubellimicrobium sp.]|nr:SLC13 family permease [Rubellimicrobium sp.]
MTQPQMLILGIMVMTMGLFLWGRLRHDVVALAALLASVLAGLVPAELAFKGFGNPAVITVACVLILSRGLYVTGAVDGLARAVLPRRAGRLGSMAALMLLGAALSGFMNNVGAMALLMPVAVQLAGRLELAPGQLLMPLAFGTILGGMTTLIGTPPNLIVAGFRAEARGAPFGMFDFAPVGVAVALAGVIFVVILGWRLVPLRKSAAGQAFETGAYLTELRVPARSRAVDMTLRDVEADIDKSGAQIVALVRNEVRINAPHGGRLLRAGDILIVEADVDGLAEAMSAFGLVLEEQGHSSETAPGDEDEADPASGSVDEGEGATGKEAEAAAPRDEEPVLRELVVLPDSTLVGRSATELRLRTRSGLNLLAVSRSGRSPQTRLRALKLRSGDLLLMQGPAEAMADFVAESGCVPMGERDLRIPEPRMALIAGAIMLASVALVAFGILPAAVAFALGALASMVLRTVPARQVYAAIDWPVVVLLGALIPVAGAMEATGAADLVARFLVENVAQGNAVAALAVILVTTMFLSDVMNNAATAAVMCPVALGIAATLGVSPDSFLMAVAIGASCAFLTPIGHQNNTIILGPGGFRFGDYWRLGLPLEVLVVAISLPLLLMVWPL